MIILFWLVALVAVILDRATKLLAVDTFEENITNTVLKAGDIDILSFTMHYNTGAAFSSFSGRTRMLIIVTIIAMIVMTIYFHFEKHKHPLMTICFAMVVGGGIGNLIDRTSQLYVVDFIKLYPFNFIFNVADVFVVIGAILLVIYYLFVDEKYKKRFILTAEQNTGADTGANTGEGTGESGGTGDGDGANEVDSTDKGDSVNEVDSMSVSDDTDKGDNRADSASKSDDKDENATCEVKADE